MRTQKFTKIFGLYFRFIMLSRCGAIAGFGATSAYSVTHDDERSYYSFETFQTCAMDLSPAGKGLAVANTPNNTLDLFSILESGELSLVATVKVGLEPSCVKWRSNTEIWVVNHISDSISIVNVSNIGTPRVVRTLKVGDMPYSVAFGAGGKYAFVPTKRRDIMQKTYNDFTGGLDVWVFDTQQLDTGLPVKILNYFAEGGVEIAANSTGDMLYTMPLHSGNMTTIAPAKVVDGDLPEPTTNVYGDPAPPVGLVAKADELGVWRDGAGRDISQYVKLKLTDNDVCTIDATGATPVAGSCVNGVGTILYGAAVAPDGTVYVSNTDADNIRRFEGTGAFGGSTISGRHHLNYITVIHPNGDLTKNWVNNHLNLDAGQFSDTDRQTSLALLTDLVLSDDGSTLYAAAFGSSKIGIFDTNELKNGTFVPDPSKHIVVSGGGPTSLVYDGPRNRLYALTRFNNSVVTVDLTSKQEIASTPMYDPEPSYIVDGRRFLYDASFTSGPGNVACGSCHVFGGTDELSWDLGNPDAAIAPNLNIFVFQDPSVDVDFHPMKVPMFTSTLKGMRHHGPMHWRGDKNGAAAGADPLDEKAAFKQFIGAFEGVNARSGPISDAEMDMFADFALDLVLEPNYYRPVDGVLSPQQERGRNIYFNVPVEVDNGFACNDCHTMDPSLGFFGTSGLSTTRSRRPDSPALKIAQIALVPDKISAPETIPFPDPEGKNYRGYYLNHEGSTYTLFAFLRSPLFRFPNGDDDRKDLMSFLMAAPRSMENTVGQQVILGVDNLKDPVVRAFLSTLEARAKETSPVSVCDLTVSGVINNEPRGFVMLSNGKYLSDRLSEGQYTKLELLKLANTPGQQLTFLCVPPGSGVRIGIDNDEDGVFDRDELDAGSDPSDPNSVPAIASSSN